MPDSEQSQFQFLEFPAEPELGLDLVLRQSFFARGRIGYRTDKILPTGLIAVLFNLGRPHRVGKSPEPAENPSFAHSWLDGLQSTPTYNTPTDGTHVIGLLFEPIGFHALLGTDMPKLRDRTVDAREVLPEWLVAVVESIYPRAAEASAHRELHARLAEAERRSLPSWLWSLYREILESRGRLGLTSWYESAGHSARHVASSFQRAVGVTPKRLCRVHRLLALLDAVEPAAKVQWTELAHEFEFYDQPHFNREFRQLSGLYPSEYLEQRRRDLPELGRGESVVFSPQR